MRTPILMGVAALLLAACGRSDKTGDASSAGGAGDVGGTMVITASADADYILPPLIASAAGNLVADIIFERLAEPGDKLSTVGDQGWKGELADSWAWAQDSLSIAFRLQPRARWHDGRPVTARDVRYTYEVYRDPAVGAQEQRLLAEIDSVSTPDSLTAVFWFKRRYPEQFFDAAYHMRIMPEHVYGTTAHAALRTAPATRAPVGSGRFRFARWQPGQLLEIVADTTHWRGRAKLDRIIFVVSPDYETSALKLFSGDADFIEYLRPDKVAELAKHAELTTSSFAGLDEGFIRFNLTDPANPSRPHPVLGDRDTRRALAMAVDRPRLVRAVLDTLGRLAYGPETRALASYDSTIAQLPYDLDGAKRLLDSLGWKDANGDGVRERDGRALRFTILAPTSSTNRQRMAEQLQAMWKLAGVQADIERIELNAMIDRLQHHTFDAEMDALRHDPSPSSIRQTWTAAAVSEQNYGSYRSRTFDAQLDSAVREFDPAKANVLYRRAYETIVADAPAVWLYEPINVLGRHRRIHPVGLRPDAWWANIADWYIPAGERIARDRAGLGRPTAN